MASRGERSDEEDVLDLIGGNINQDSDHASGNELQNDRDQGQESDGENVNKKVVPPVAKRTKSTVPRLTTELLKGPKGVHTIEKYFEGFKYHGKGREKEDLVRIMKRIEHWCHRLYPKFNFDDCIAKIEHLGNKRDLQVFLRRYRLGEISADDDFRTPEFVNEDDDERIEDATPQEEFDLLLAEQINKQRQNEATINTNAFDNLLASINPPVTSKEPEPQLTNEIKEKIERNRILAMERKMATIKRLQELHAAKIGDCSQEASTSDINTVQMTTEESTSSNLNDDDNATSENDCNARNDNVEDIPSSLVSEIHNPISQNGDKNDENEEQMSETETKFDEKLNEKLMPTEIEESSLEQMLLDQFQ